MVKYISKGDGMINQEYVKTYDSILGKLVLKSDGENLTSLSYCESGDETYVESNLPIFDEVFKWLDIYFSGEIPNFTPKYKFYNISPFRRSVLEITSTIPYGQTLTYGTIANRIASMKGIEKMSARAVGGALHHNPICIIVPCHRVIGTNKALVGYGGGIAKKVRLLELESSNVQKR